MAEQEILYSESRGDGTYTNEVTAETLNDIMTDLGFGEFANGDFKFEDNKEYSVDALNNITKALVTRGILQYGSKCMPSISGATVSVADGICVFDNGAKIKFNEPKTVDIHTGNTNYVYFLNDSNTNRITLVNSLTEPTEGDFVMIAVISENGVLTDRRKYSKANCKIYGDKNAMYVYELTITAKHETQTLEIELDGSEFNFVGAKDGDLFRCYKLTDDNGVDIYDGITKTWHAISGDDGNDASWTNLNITKAGAKVTIEYWHAISGRTKNIKSKLYFI